MTTSEYTYNNSTHFSSGKGFLTLFALQFLFVVATIYADVKLGMVTLSFTLLIAIIILIRRSNDEYTDWEFGSFPPIVFHLLNR